MARPWVLATFALVVVMAWVDLASTSTPERVVIGTKDGRISGIKSTSTKGREFYSFWSIPYAKPPVGPLRLKDPVAGLGWEGTRDGSVVPQSCSQIPFLYLTSQNFQHQGVEDCLFLNIFTRKPGEEGAGLPVLVFIHGGGFVAGQTDWYIPDVFLDRDLVYVSIQYRLGILGFLSTEDSVISGNFGLKDQTMALRWIQKNIHHFGGDPKKVTLFGESAGGASVHFHYLSPYSQDLFARGILQSGTLFSPWALGAAFREVAEFTGRQFGCPEVRGKSSGESSEVLLRCLQEVNFEALTLSLQHHITFNYNPALVGPRVDGDYLPAEPEVLMKQGRYKKADMISGINSHEGGLFTIPLYEHDFMQKALRDNFSEIGPESLDLTRGDEDPERLATKIFTHYAGAVRADEGVADEITEMYGDRHFNLGHEWVSQLHAYNTLPAHNTFLYNLTYRGQKALSDFYTHNVGNHWVSHVDELFYLFGGEDTIFGQLEAEEDLRLRDIFTHMWMNFALTGNPTPDTSLGFKWEAASKDNLHHLTLSSSHPSMQPDTRHQVREFWESLPTRQNQLLHPDKVIHFHHDDTRPRKPGHRNYKPQKHRHTEL